MKKMNKFERDGVVDVKSTLRNFFSRPQNRVEEKIEFDDLFEFLLEKIPDGKMTETEFKQGINSIFKEVMVRFEPHESLLACYCLQASLEAEDALEEFTDFLNNLGQVNIGVAVLVVSSVEENRNN